MLCDARHDEHLATALGRLGFSVGDRVEVRCRHRGVWFLDGVVLEVVTKYEPKKMADDTEVVLIPGMY